MRPSSIVFLNDFCIRYIQSEIESLVTHGASECYGTYNSTTKIEWGAGYENSCIHSDFKDYSGGNTVWYNYALASANTIIDKDTTSNNPVINMNTATESVCPKGWNLPFAKQINSNRSLSSFLPVLGGYYYNGTINNESIYGRWWGSETSINTTRYFLDYNGTTLYTNDAHRNDGFYIRCVSEEKTVTDLTYMQDMTPKIAPVLSLCI